MDKKILQNNPKLNLFFTFLKERGVYAKFKALSYSAGLSLGFYRQVILDGDYMNPRQYLTSAFLWEVTREGDRFWRVINAEWREKYCSEDYI